MKDAVNAVGGLLRSLAHALLVKPVRERGWFWTAAAWIFVLNSIALFGQMKGGLVFSFVIWFVSLYVFLRLHTKQKRRARPLPYKRR